MNPIEAAARAALKPKDRRPPWQWIEENVKIRNSPFGSRPNFSKTPWLKEPSELFPDNRRHMFTLQCCVQGAKSFFMSSHGIWALCEDAGPMGIYVQTEKHVKKFAETRFSPMVEECVALQKFIRRGRGDRHATRTAEFNFTHTFAYIMSANPSNAQSLSLRYVFNDECFIWDKGLLWETHKRATQWWNRRIVNASTPGDVDTDLDKCFEAGDKRERRMMCPNCAQLQVPDFGKHIKWPTNEITKPNGRWNFDAVKRETRFVCEHCGAKIPHTEENSRLMNERGDYLVTNESAPFDQVSFRWNALVLSPSVLTWGDLAAEWIVASKAWKAGYQEPMREFNTKREAKSFNPKKINPFENLPVIELQSPEADAGGRQKFWELQDFIFMGVDVQMHSFFVLVMAFGAGGDECAIFGAEVYNWSDVEEIQKRYGVADEDVMVDWSHRPTEVVQECARRGHWTTINRKKHWICWKALVGTDDYHFIYQAPNGMKVPLPYSWPPKSGDPSLSFRPDDPRKKDWLGKECQIIRWSNPSIKDIVIARRDGRVKAVRVETAKGDWNKEYFRQMHSQKKVQVAKQYGRSAWKYENFTDDHYLDARCMCTVRAVQKGLIMDVSQSLAEVELPEEVKQALERKIEE